MTSRRHKRYLRRMFEGETGDYVKNLLTDGQWRPEEPGGSNYCVHKQEAAEIVGTVFALILIGAVGFGVWKFLVWIF